MSSYLLFERHMHARAEFCSPQPQLPPVFLCFGITHFVALAHENVAACIEGKNRYPLGQHILWRTVILCATSLMKAFFSAAALLWS